MKEMKERRKKKAVNGRRSRTVYTLDHKFGTVVEKYKRNSGMGSL